MRQPAYRLGPQAAFGRTSLAPAAHGFGQVRPAASPAPIIKDRSTDLSTELRRFPLRTQALNTPVFPAGAAQRKAAAVGTATAPYFAE